MVEVTGIVETADDLCVGGVYTKDYAADSRPGPYSTNYSGDRLVNIFGVTSGPGGEGDCTRRAAPHESQDVCSPGAVPVDTLAPTATCPTPTLGVLPPNPFWAPNQNQPCMLDDDIVGNAVLREYRPSGYSATASF